VKSLLVVDDDPAILDSLSTLLGASYRVLTARDGEEGLRALERAPVDLVVLDMLMPLMDGEEMLREVRARGWTMPILVVSAHADRLVDAAALGADDLLLKPFDTWRLEEKIERLLRRRSSSGEAGSSGGPGLRPSRGSGPDSSSTKMPFGSG
jgi:DNA-binding response OmpR family regulator